MGFSRRGQCWPPNHLEKVQDFKFKGGKGAETGADNYMPGDKAQDKIV